MGLKMWSKIETNRIQLLYTLSPQHNAKVTKMFKDPVRGGGGGGSAHSHYRGLGWYC